MTTVYQSTRVRRLFESLLTGLIKIVPLIPVPINTDHRRSMTINADQCQSILTDTNADQCPSLPINAKSIILDQAIDWH